MACACFIFKKAGASNHIKPKADICKVDTDNNTNQEGKKIKINRKLKNDNGKSIQIMEI